MALEKSMDSISVGLEKIIAHNELLRNREIEHLKQIEKLKNLLSMEQEPSIWRDIDKHPLPANIEPCKIDLKLDCESILKDCIMYDTEYILFRGHLIIIKSITQWRDAK